MTKLLRNLRRVALLAAFVIVVAVAYTYVTLRESLPALDGSLPLAGLAAPVVVARDEAGVPTLTAASRVDLARALGYVHAQERFFQMDLLRRMSAGELSALVGAGALEVDKRSRVHRFRAVAKAAVAAMSPEDRAIGEAYAAGVNAGLAALKGPAFEYRLLQAKPEPWQPEDSLLVAYAMWLDLQESDGHRQIQRDLLHATLSAPAFAFVTGEAPEWESTLDGVRSPAAIVPDAADFDLRAQPDLEVRPPEEVLHERAMLGSNNWAVAGKRTGTGIALVANDMHLGFSVPNIWFRARLRTEDAAGPVDVTGVTLPGTPFVIAGSNGHIAWGFTNSYGEYQTIVRLEPVAGHDDQYQTASGVETLRVEPEIIAVKGGAPVTLNVEESRWGPVVARDWDGRRMALAWTAHSPEATNLALMRLEHANSVQEALGIGPALGMPGQNFTVGDDQGHIGWTIAGRIGVHAQTNGLPQSSTAADVGLHGWMDPDQYPRIVDPEEGLIWTANARVLLGPGAERIGVLGADRGARAGQIHAGLVAAGAVTPRASLAIQLDDRSLFLERWKNLLERTLNEGSTANRPDREAMRAVLGHWSGHAAVDDPAYRLVRRFREEVEIRAFYMLVAPARAKASAFKWAVPTEFEGPLWTLLEKRPPQLLAARYATWESFLLEAADAAAILPQGCRTLLRCTWGTVHVTRVMHPLARALPALGSALNMPERRLPGDEDMPRVIARSYGASERFSVSPGREREAYFHMPGGESGHPLSRYYRTGFDAWANGEPTPFLPGTTTHTLRLVP